MVMKYLFIFITTILFAAMIVPDSASAEDMVRVSLVNHLGDTSTLDLHLKGEYFTLDKTLPIEEGGTYTLSVEKEKLLLRDQKKTYEIGDSLILIPKMYDQNHLVYINERPYLGAMELRLEGKEFIRPVNQLPLEDYLKGVVPFEVYPSWGLETLKAQALAARTYATARLDQEIDDTIRFQVYGGYTWSEKTTKAVKQTRGEVITYKNKLIDAFYSASNGGITESNAHVWGGNSLPYFPIKKDPYDPIQPWTFTLNETQIDVDQIDWNHSNWWDMIHETDPDITKTMKRVLNKSGYPGDIKILSISDFELSDQQWKSGRSVKGSITIEFLQRLVEGTVLVRQLKLDNEQLKRIRPLIGGAKFKSYLIDSLEKVDDVYTMKGRGYGHGVGMSQWGANIMGENGKNYQDIIEFYYPGTNIVKKNNLIKK